jgi:two-component system sensor histidine kinase TctE
MAVSSLRAALLLWLLLPLTAVSALDSWLAYRSSRDTALLMQERMLLGAARMIGEQVHLEDGVVEVVIPPAALELFASPSLDRVYYRASDADGRLLSGYADLPLPTKAPAPEDSVFFDAAVEGRPVHVVSFAQPVFAGHQQQVLVQVAQTGEGRERLARELWGAALARQLGLLVLVGLLLWLGLRHAMAPILRLRDRMLARPAGAVDPLGALPVPTELRPLVDAVNDYAGRLDRHMNAHSRFIANASHQLRTPLALLNTQVTYALRNPQPEARQEALQAIHASVQHGIRAVEQLLTFTRAEAAGLRSDNGPVDLVGVAREVLEAMALRAQQRGIDLGWQGVAEPCIVAGNARILGELVTNLVDNALRYTPSGGIVNVAVVPEPGRVVLTVEDNGPGIPPAERERVFERFYRLHDRDSEGSGLGLAIVREIARSHGARITLATASGGRGLLVRVDFSFSELP